MMPGSRLIDDPRRRARGARSFGVEDHAPGAPPRALRTAIALAGLGLFAGGLAGCTLAPTAPSLDAVEPAWGYNGEATDVEISGNSLFPAVVVSGWEGDDGRVEGTFQAWLVGNEDVPLSGVESLSYERLRAEVPSGISPGVYDVKVEVPSGLTTTLPDAFTVTDTRADHLALSVATAAYIVGDYAPVTIRVEDPADQAVAQAMEVEVTATSPSGADGVSFYETGLGEQIPSEEGIGVRGWLGNDGTGTFLVTSSHSDDVTLQVVPVADDGVVRGGELYLSWDPGPVDHVDVVLPRADFRTQAGDTFAVTLRLRDELGNLLTSQPADLLLRDECGDWIAADVSIVGEGTVDATLTGACASDVIHAYAFGTEWESEPFEVLPGEMSAYALQAAPNTVVAGIDPLVVLVEAVDAWGNVIHDHVADLRLYDDVGGLDPDRSIGTQSCPGFSEGVQVCTAKLWASSPAAVVRGDDGAGHVGYSGAIEVLPGAPDSVIVSTPATRVEAGEEFEVTVRVVDALGNTVSFDPGGTDPVAFVDDSGTIACTWSGPEEGAQAFTCTIEGAEDDAHVGAAVLGLSAEVPDPVQVTNAALADVEVDPQAATFTAGTAFTLELRGFDTYGNPYVVQSDPVLDLTDGSGSFTPTTALLGTTGTVQVSATVRIAGPAVRIEAEQGGTVLGTSPAITVTAGALDALRVDTPAWVDLDTPGEVVVTAVDTYGNAISGYLGPVTLTARGGGCDTALLTTFTSGAAVARVSCATPTLSEVLEAEDDAGYVGESDLFDVVDLGCADGPDAVLTLDGDADATRCISSTATAVDIDVDASGSTAGGSGIVVYHFDDGQEISERTLASSTTMSYSEAGARHVQALVVDSRACATLAEGNIFLAKDDGEAAGPVTVSASAGSVSSAGSVTVSVAATDCTADVAAGQSLFVRADLGSPTGTSTGAGLSFLLDGTGTASIPWVFDTGYSGTATFSVGTADGGAFGSTTVAVTGDSVLPEVVEMTPSGVDLGDVDAVTIVFDEPMYAANMTSFYLTLSGPSGTSSATYSLSADLTTLTITPSSPVDASTGTWTVGVSRNIRDLAGNRLDGQWSDSQAPFTGSFGDVPNLLPELSSCTVSPATFFPDGDDGAGDESDVVTIVPTATGSPTWWWLEVTAPGGDRVRSLRELGTSASIGWDGRGDDGFIADAGSYALTLSPVDTYGNIGEGCHVTIELGQHVAAP
jgi:hypothetical protein